MNLSWDPVAPRRHGCRFVPRGQRRRGLALSCVACRKTWRFDGLGWLRIKPDGGEWLAQS